MDPISFLFLVPQGVGAPVGALLAGSRELIAEAWRARKLLGGGMRQVGVLAAAALVGLSCAEETLQRDHINARRFAQGACAVRGGNDMGPLSTPLGQGWRVDFSLQCWVGGQFLCRTRSTLITVENPSPLSSPRFFCGQALLWGS